MLTEIEQSCCRQLCSLLQALARPTKNTITYHIDHTPGLEVLASSILRQLYRKAVALWETFFEHLRSWAFGFRNKTGFPRQKKAVATSLAQICKSIDTYSHAHREVQDVVSWSPRHLPSSILMQIWRPLRCAIWLQTIHCSPRSSSSSAGAWIQEASTKNVRTDWRTRQSSTFPPSMKMERQHLLRE